MFLYPASIVQTHADKHLFDPDYKWLGIKPIDQPPNHYRLLGLVLFEDDPDVIDAAATQRSAHVKSFAGGPHGELSQQILNEIARARNCLIVATKKLGCDDELRQKAANARPPAQLSLKHYLQAP